MAHMFPRETHPALTVLPGAVNHQHKRSLPSRDISETDFDDAYAAFIIYCNPSVPADTDSAELRKIFWAPPKSDGKTFSTFALFDLIKRLEAKEIKTWAQLVEEMGVEKPLLEKGQSTQKVQQYAVRLKRWMHALHIDAFFEYLNGNAHVYFTHIPAANDSASIQERDGVPPEEDLALRALLPETRPKRGRRKAEDKEEQEFGKSPSQRPRIQSPGLSEEFMLARSALTDGDTLATGHPDYHHLFSDRMNPWSSTEARSAVAPAFRWPPESSLTPMSAYPQSAFTPSMNRTHLWNDVDEPQSALTPKSRSRRKHGPAVSSAWPSNGSNSSGKVRGRPPSNRSVQDGPFSTFPANPVPKDRSRLQDHTPAVTPTFSEASIINPRPSRLQLQVPERQGGAVRLATPPPVVLVNGQDNVEAPEDNMLLDTQPQISHMEYFYSPNMQNSSVQNRISITSQQNADTGRTNIDTLESHITYEILAAEWFDTTGNNIERCTMEEADKICKQVIQNLQAESSNKEAFLISLSALAGPLTTQLKMTKHEQGSASRYESCWKMKFGAIEGDLTIQATVQHSNEPIMAEAEPEESEESWKKKYLDLRQEIRLRDEKEGKLKKGMLDALVNSEGRSGAG